MGGAQQQHAQPPKDITAQNQVMTQQHYAPRDTSLQSQATPQQQHAQPPKDITAQNLVMTQQHHAPRVTSQQSQATRQQQHAHPPKDTFTAYHSNFVNQF